jgi:hypothetical protein
LRKGGLGAERRNGERREREMSAVHWFLRSVSCVAVGGESSQSGKAGPCDDMGTGKPQPPTFYQTM